MDQENGRVAQTRNICNEKGNITIDSKDINRTIMKYKKQLCANKLSNFDEMDTCLKRYKLSKVIQEEKTLHKLLCMLMKSNFCLKYYNNEN